MANNDPWVIVHKLVSDGLAKGQASPLNLRWGKSLGSAGYITYGIPITGLATDISQPSITKPYLTDFQLYLAAPTGPAIMGGFITECAIEDWSENRVLSIAGKSWEHYFERIIWPKDPNSTYRTTTAADPTNGTVFDYTGTIDYLIYRLATESLALANSLSVPGLSNPGAGAGTFRYRIDPGDTTTIWEHFNNIFSLGDTTLTPYIAMDPLTRFFATAPMPRYGTSATPTYKFTTGATAVSGIGGGNCEITGFRHGGIRGTRMFGIATGPSSKKAAFQTLNDATFRRWDIVEEFTKGNAYANLATLVSAAITDAQIPDIEIQIKYYDMTPEQFFPTINEAVFPGTRVWLEADLQWININDHFTVVAVECVVTDEGVAEYTATLNQPTVSTF